MAFCSRVQILSPTVLKVTGIWKFWTLAYSHDHLKTELKLHHNGPLMAYLCSFIRILNNGSIFRPRMSSIQMIRLLIA